jgi:hypothetical protein
VLDQCLGDRPGAGAKLDHGPFAVRIDVLRHSARERLARRGDGADGERLLDPRADEADFVVDPDAVLLEAAKLCLDILPNLSLDTAERQLHLLLEMLFEQPDTLFDVLSDFLLDAPQRALDLALESRLEEADALLEILADHLFEQLDPLFELFERLKGHRRLRPYIAGL